MQINNMHKGSIHSHMYANYIHAQTLLMVVVYTRSNLTKESKKYACTQRKWIYAEKVINKCATDSRRYFIVILLRTSRMNILLLSPRARAPIKCNVAACW